MGRASCVRGFNKSWLKTCSARSVLAAETSKGAPNPSLWSLTQDAKCELNRVKERVRQEPQKTSKSSLHIAGD